MMTLHKRQQEIQSLVEEFCTASQESITKMGTLDMTARGMLGRIMSIENTHKDLKRGQVYVRDGDFYDDSVDYVRIDKAVIGDMCRAVANKITRMRRRLKLAQAELRNYRTTFFQALYVHLEANGVQITVTTRKAAHTIVDRCIQRKLTKLMKG